VVAPSFRTFVLEICRLAAARGIDRQCTDRLALDLSSASSASRRVLGRRYRSPKLTLQVNRPCG
jgi:hypothetical protein